MAIVAPSGQELPVAIDRREARPSRHADAVAPAAVALPLRRRTNLQPGRE